MSQVQRQRFTIFHNELLDFLLLNAGPGAQNKAAVHFGVTPSSISIIVNSDIFQARLRDRQDVKHEGVVATIQDKMVAAADIALEKLHMKLAVEQDTKVLADATDKLLGRLGYGAKSETPKAPLVQNNTFLVSAEDLAVARARMMNGKEVVSEQSALPAPEDIEGHTMGEGESFGAGVLEGGEAERSTETR